ncbi:flagellar biosynthesis repressor FlbT [Geobacter sp. SVR]|uniref:flagellar biosynthesis repressor FlbT n=1 Tax=Geobacter sp. SVR TaxID=2495594 RepID=UPI00143EFF3C|nr:flagellar biosynthesis repressor FlbT [Geobacter sp. SVR]BCS55982.1 putative flagellum biosynthesis repressor protein FlbT 1 [Geobacter sp. SVR]GCF84745.1 putative flagellum biosynthesis repressor protein FlbT 1 [Geobacter sp. SVR]
MSLKIRLKPHEKVLIGHAVLRNGDKTSEFHIENKIAILREKDIMKEEDASTPGERLYFLIQLMYIDGDNLVKYHHTYWEQVKQIVSAAASTRQYLEEISSLILEQDYYHALKAARRLMEYEKCLVSRIPDPTEG